MSRERGLERHNIVLANLPVDLDDGVLTTDIVSTKLYDKFQLVVPFGDGTAGDDITVTLQQCTDVSNSLSDNKALNCLETGRIFTKMAADETALRALTAWTEETQATADEVYTDTDSGEQCGIWVFEIFASDLDRDSGFDCWYATVDGDGGAAKLGCVMIVCLDPRYKGVPTAMPDPLVD